jgi:hypothetical protein
MQGALGGAGADLGARLAALRSQYGLQQAELGQKQQFENYYQPGQEGLLSQIAGPAAQAAMAWATGGLTGVGAFGRGAMDAYRGSPSQGTQSAYQNFFNRMNPQQNAQPNQMAQWPMQTNPMNPQGNMQGGMNPMQSSIYNKHPRGTMSPLPQTLQQGSSYPTFGESFLGQGFGRMGSSIGSQARRLGGYAQNAASTASPYLYKFGNILPDETMPY